jgi:hypothetical protein
MYAILSHFSSKAIDHLCGSIRHFNSCTIPPDKMTINQFRTPFLCSHPRALFVLTGGRGSTAARQTIQPADEYQTYVAAV